MKNLSRLLVMTLIASTVLVGCGSAKKEVVEEAPVKEEVVVEDKTETIDEVADEIATLEEEVEEDVEEVAGEAEEAESVEEGTELEDYLAANPDLYKQLQEQAAANSSDDLNCTIEAKGNTLVFTLSLNETFSESERTVIAETLMQQEDTFATIYGSVDDVYGKLCGAEVSTKLIFVDASGAEILSLEY